MEVREYQEIINKTKIYPQEVGLAYCALGLNGEAGEVAEKIKKLYRDKPEFIDYLRLGIAPADKILELYDIKKGLEKEIGDVMWYITALAQEIGSDLETIMKMNYDKLIARRVTDTLSGSGDDREENMLKVVK